MKENIEELIEKFWTGTASVQEREKLLGLLNENDSQLKEKLEASFLKTEESKIVQLINLPVQTALLKKIHQQTGIAPVKEKSGLKRWPVMRFTVAASIIGAVCTITWLTIKNRDAAQVPQMAQNTQVRTVEILNLESRAKQVTLPDHSNVLLEPKSGIRYDSEFGKLTRYIQLTGKARFNVAHDKARPFSVFTNGYSTTALGTEFIVNGKKGNTFVELLSGKVVVKDNTGSRMKAVFMKPGDELTLNNLDGKFELVSNLKPKQLKLKVGLKQEQRSPEVSGTEIRFKATPLTEVFARIEQMKNIKVTAEGAAIENMVFTGDFLPDDSLETMLSMICEINNLEYKIDQGRVIIK